MKFSLCLLPLLVAACATTSRLPTELQHEDSIRVMQVQNLSGVPLKVPSVYFGDAIGKGAELDIETVDLALLAEAAAYARLSELGYKAELDPERENTPDYELHAAMTFLDMTQVRQTGRFRMAITVMLIDVAQQTEVAQGSADQEFQLLDVAPDEAGALGTGRFIEERLQTFTEGLTRAALDSAGF